MSRDKKKTNKSRKSILKMNMIEIDGKSLVALEAENRKVKETLKTMPLCICILKVSII